MLELPSGTKVYIDANIFLFSAFNHPQFGHPCRDFLTRIEEEGTGYVSDLTLNEVFHKLMIAEVSKILRVKPSDALSRIKWEPEVISRLEVLWEEMELIENSGINMLPPQKLFPDFVDISRKFNLTATDAMIVGIMKKNDIKDIATNDRDFERVDFLRVWKP